MPLGSPKGVELGEWNLFLSDLSFLLSGCPPQALLAGLRHIILWGV